VWVESQQPLLHEICVHMPGVPPLLELLLLEPPLEPELLLELLAGVHEPLSQLSSEEQVTHEAPDVPQLFGSDAPPL
jgi:hypothetical protein